MVPLPAPWHAKPAMEMLLTGDMTSADDARRIGLVNRVVEPGAAREEALKLARKIAAKSAAVVRLGKEAFYRQLEMDPRRCLQLRQRNHAQEHDDARRPRKVSPRSWKSAHRSGRIGDPAQALML